MAGCRLLAALNTASEEVAAGRAGPSSRHLKPIVTAVEKVFASAAAVSAAFGLKVPPSPLPTAALPSTYLCCTSASPLHAACVAVPCMLPMEPFLCLAHSTGCEGIQCHGKLPLSQTQHLFPSRTKLRIPTW